MINDVIVVGAGFAGLRASRDLAAAGLRVLVLDGNERIGGRAYSQESTLVPPLRVEMGGAYMHRHHHPRLAAELDRYGVRTVPAPEPTVFRNRLGEGQRDSLLPIPEDEAVETEAGLFRLLRDAHRIDVDAGLENQGLDDLDIPLQDYIDGLGLGPVGRQLLMSWCWNMMGQPPTEASALWALQFVAAHGHSVLGVMFSIEEVVPDGISELADAMAADVPSIELRTRVTAVRIRDDAVVEVDAIHDGATTTHLARRVVMAIPLNTWRDVRFEPPLPAARAAVAGEGHGGRGLKVLVQVSGVPEGLSCTGDGVFPTLYDYLPVPDGSRLLVAFTDSDSFDPTDKGAVEAAVHHYVPEAVVHGIEYHDWCADPLFRGPWVSPRVGQFSKVHKALGEPHGPVLFIGSDVSLRFPAYIEGALETAERAAASILEGLAATDTP